MKFLSVCSGIEAASVAWHPLGWESVAYSEIEPFPCKVLQHHYPDVPNLGDMTKFKEWPDADVDVFVGGTPCQSFSVAGLRKGLDDPRGNLMLTYLAIAKRYRPKWLVWENVPGVLSSADGRDFGSLLGGLAILGYGFAYRVLDAQYFGVAQRRKRVFVVGYFGDWRPAAAVLFERHSLQGHSAPSREKGKRPTASIASGAPISDYDVAGTLDKGTPGRGIGHNGNYDSQVVSMSIWPAEVSSTLDTTFGTKMGLENQHVNAGCPMFVPAQPIPLNTMNCFRSPNADASTGCGIGEAGEAMFTITKANSHAVAQPIAIAENTIGRKPENGGNGDGFTENGPMYTLNATGVHGVAQPIAFSGQMSNPQTDVDMTQTLGAKNPMAVAVGTDCYNGTITGEISMTLKRGDGNPAINQPTVIQAMAVRRLTPVECERLQGFPDRYTDIQPKGKPTPDGPRYKALGNSMAVPVMAWIGKRIQEVEAICKTQQNT
jgi:DNA (cytosine-5)-methyltransferase 1